MHFYYCNDAAPWLNEVISQIFRCTVIFKNFQIHLHFVCYLPATCLPAVRSGSATYTGPIFLTKKCNWRLQYESVVPKKIYPLRHDDSFHPSLAFIALL